MGGHYSRIKKASSLFTEKKKGKLRNIDQSGPKEAKAIIFSTLCRGKKGYDLNEKQGMVSSYFQNDKKMMLKSWFFTHFMAGSVTIPKLYNESMAHYQNKCKCLKTLNSLIKGDAKGDLKEMR